jgi:acyl transferase domain-containing protein
MPVSDAPIVFMFSGQGSQHYQMGRELFDHVPAFRRHLRGMDALATELIGTSIVEALYDERQTRTDPFERTLLTHPAIVMVELAIAQTLIEQQVIPEYVLGASLGSYPAAVVAGCLSLEEALTSVIKQASLFEACCARGGMIAVLGDVNLHRTDPVVRQSEVAAVNSSRHFVVACEERHLFAIEERLRVLDVSHQRLPVSHAFHSRWIDQAREPFIQYAQAVPLRDPCVPLVCCATGRVLTTLPEHYFWSVAREPIRFDRAVEHLEARGACRYVDVGPSGSLATMLKYLLPSTSRSTVANTLGFFGNDRRNLDAVIAGYARTNHLMAQ